MSLTEGSGAAGATVVDLREFATVLVEERGSNWIDPTEDVVLDGLITAVLGDDAAVRERAETTLRAITPERLHSWLRSQLQDGGPMAVDRVAAVVAHLQLIELVPDLVGVALRSSSTDLDVVGTALRSFTHFRELLEWMQAPSNEAEAVERTESAARRDASLAERLAAADVAGKIGMMARLHSAIKPGPLADRLIELASSDPSEDVRLAAIKALGGAEVGTRLQAADAILKRGPVPVRIAALGLASTGSVDEMSLLVEALHDKSPKVAKEAISRLGTRPAPEALAILWGAMLGVSRERQQLILDLLLQFDRRSVALLARQVLESDQARERMLGIWVLGSVDPAGSRDQLLDALTDPSLEVRLEAVGALRSLNDPLVVDAVGDRVRDPEPAVRVRTVEVLAEMDPALAARHLLDACKDPADDVKLAAEAALLEQPAAVAPVLVEALSSRTHRRIARNLIARSQQAATPALLAAVPLADEAISSVIGELLVETSAIDRLREDLESRAPEQRLAALDGLRVMRAVEDIDAIAARLEDPVALVRVRAAEVLAALGDERAVEPLKTAFVSDPDMSVVAAIESALRALTEDHSGS